jgi:hypothetical protein
MRLKLFSLAASVALFVLSIVRNDASAAIVLSYQSTVLPGSMYSYSTFGSGDVVFALSGGSGLSQCAGGFWLRPSDAGFKTNVAVLLSAIQGQTAIRVYADDSQIWNGSSAQYCLVYMTML